MAQDKPEFVNGVVDSSSDETDSLPLLTLSFPVNGLCNPNNLSQVFLQNSLNDDTMYLQDLEDGNTGWTLDGLPVLFTTDGQPILLNTLSEVANEESTINVASSLDEDNLDADTTFNTLQPEVFSSESLSKLTTTENLTTDEILTDSDINNPLEISSKVILTEDGLFFPMQQEVSNEDVSNEISAVLQTPNVSRSCDAETQTDFVINKLNVEDDQSNLFGLSSELSELAYVITVYKCKRCLFTCSDKQIFLEHFRDSHLQHLKNSISNTAQLLSKNQILDESEKSSIFSYKTISLPESEVQGIQSVADVTSAQLNSNSPLNISDDLQSTLRSSFVIETEDGSIEIDASTLIDSNVLNNVNNSSDKLNTIVNKNVEEMDCTVSSSEQEQFDEFIVTTENIKEEPIDIEEKYIYICSQCSDGFASILDCRQHMIKDHKLKVVDTWEQRMNVKKIDNSSTIPEIQSPETNSILVSLLNSPKAVNVSTSTNTLVPPEIPKTETNEKATPVDINKKMFTKALLKLKKGNGPLPFKCRVRGCSYRFVTQEVCDRHVQCHQFPDCNDDNTKNLSSSYKCSECEQPQRSWRATSMHLWRQHNIQTDLLTCPICYTHKAATAVKLQDHMKIHSDVRSYVCPDCGSAFKQPSQLRNHRIVHLDKHSENTPSWYREKECTQCQKIFSDSKCLKKHIQSVHSKLKPFICNVCGHSCARKAMLQMHLRQHTGEKPYECTQCPYRTGDHNSLRRHKMKHSGVRPYKCPHCSYSSIQSNAYKNHIMSKHPGKTGIYSCAICAYLTVSEEGYLSHIADHAKGLIQANPASKNDIVNNTSENSISSSMAGTNILFFTSSKNMELSTHLDSQNQNNGQKSPTSSDNDELCYLQTDISDEQCLDTGGITIPAEPDCASLLTIQQS